VVSAASVSAFKELARRRGDAEILYLRNSASLRE
jgi:hypothetical protein